MTSIPDSFNVILNPTPNLADTQAAYERILEAIKSPETVKSVASPENIEKLALILARSKPLGVKILSDLAETEPGMAALESVALRTASGQRCWVHALAELLQRPSSIVDDAMGILVRFASRSSKCACSAPLADLIPYLKGLLRSSTRKCVVLSLGMLCALARASPALAGRVAADKMHGTLIILANTWDKTSAKELLELVACLAALSQDFALSFIRDRGLDALCKRARGPHPADETAPCAHALEALTRGGRLEAISDTGKESVLDVVLGPVTVEPTRKNFLIRDMCARVLNNFLEDEYAVEYIKRSNKIQSIEYSQDIVTLAEFYKKFKELPDKPNKAEMKKPAPAAAAAAAASGNEGGGDGSSEKSDNESRKRAPSSDGGKKDDDCVVTGGTAPPCKRPAVAEGAKSTPLLMLPERAYLFEPPGTPIIPKDFGASAKPPKTFREAFDKLGLPACVYGMCDEAAALALKDWHIKSKLSLEEARAIALFTVTSIPGGGGGVDPPAATLAKIFRDNNYAMMGKWEPYVALLWTAVNRLKFTPQDGYCWVGGDVGMRPHQNIFFPAFFCTTTSQDDLPQNNEGGEMYIFYMKQVPAYNITKFAVPLDESGSKAKEFFISFPGRMFEVERCDIKIGNNRKMATLKYKDSIYD